MFLASDVTFIFVCLNFPQHHVRPFWFAWTFMNENTKPIVSGVMACSFTKDFRFQIAIYSPACHGKNRTYFCFVVQKMEHKKDERWKVSHLAVGDKYIIVLCAAANNPNAAVESELSHSPHPDSISP